MRLPIHYVLPGMILQSPVLNNNGQLLLRKESVLTNRHIASLKLLKILTLDVKIHNKLLENPFGFNYTVSTSALDIIEKFLQGSNKFTFASLMKIIEDIVSGLTEGKIITQNLTNLCSTDIYTYAHSVDVCMLSVSIGYMLDYSKSKLVSLGCGSLLHDIGKTEIPINLLNKPGKLTEDEFNEIKRHPKLGYDMAKKIEEIPSKESLNIILNHHEKFDGTGYPRGLRGNQISEMDVICSLADVYNAVTTDRSYRKALPPHEAYEMIMASGGGMYKYDVVTAFLKLVKPYPIGSAVKLSNGLSGIVTDIKNDLVFRPEVMLLETGEYFDLRKDNTIVITGPLSDQEIRDLALDLKQAKVS